MSAVATNCAYQVIVKPNPKKDPTLGVKRIEAIKASVEKYLRDK